MRPKSGCVDRRVGKHLVHNFEHAFRAAILIEITRDKHDPLVRGANHQALV